MKKTIRFDKLLTDRKNIQYFSRTSGLKNDGIYTDFGDFWYHFFAIFARQYLIVYTSTAKMDPIEANNDCGVNSTPIWTE